MQLEGLRLRKIIKYGLEDQVSEARHLLNVLHTDSKVKERRRTGEEDTARTRHPGTEIAVVGPAACRP